MLYSENDTDTLDFDAVKIVTPHNCYSVRHGGKTRYSHTQRYLPASGQHGYRMGRYGRRNAADDAEFADTHDRRPPRRERRYEDRGSEETTRFVC